MSKRRFEPYATTLSPEVAEKLRELAASARLPAAAIVRELLTIEALNEWAERNGIGNRRFFTAGASDDEIAAEATVPEAAE